MQRYFLLPENNFCLSKEDIFHIKNVMRMKVGDEFEIVNNEGVFLCKIKDLVDFQYISSKKLVENNELKGHIRLLYCIPKGDKIELVIQKATELGVKEIVLINSSRSIGKIDSNNKEKKLLRFNKIIKEASEQSKRDSLLILKDVISFKDIINYKAEYSFIAYEKDSINEKIEILSYINDLKDKTINILIGPEGGFSEEEVEYAIKNNYISTSLGHRILRSETACLSILSLLSYYLD